MAEQADRRVSVGRVSGVFGVRGWVRIYSYTSPRLNIVNYTPWHLRLDGSSSCHELVAGREHGDGIIAQLRGIDDRDAAAALLGAGIEVDRVLFGEAPPGEFFWADLEGMEVRRASGQSLGRLDHLVETGANDVMVVVGARRTLVPFVYGQVVLDVDADRRVITVEWHDDE